MDKKALTMPMNALSTGSLGGYIHWVNQIPLLSDEEELTLAENLQKNNDIESARKLVMSHLRFVVRIARGYAGYGLSQADLIQEGNIGLMKAVKRFDPKVGVRLVSFAVHWIRAEIHEFIIRNWRIVKIATTKAQRKLFFNLRKAAKQRGWFSDEEVAAVANELNVSQKDVRQMEMRLNSYDQAFELNDSDDDDNPSWQAPVNYLEDHSQNPAASLENQNTEEERNSLLYQAINNLDDRSQAIIKSRWLNDNKETLQALSDKFGVSIERVRQLEKSALNKMRGAMAAS